jgi:hypothetical protein
MRLIPRAMLLGLLALPLAAQSSPFSVDVGFINGLDSLDKATHKTTGLRVGADYQTVFTGTEVPVRVGLTWASLPGSPYNGLKTSLTLSQLHGDILMDKFAHIVRPVLGVSLNHYSMSQSGIENTADPLDRDHHFPIREVKGVKIGVRAGVDFIMSNHLELEVLFQQTELAGKDLADPMVRAGGINPAWFEFNLRYRF